MGHDVTPFGAGFSDQQKREIPKCLANTRVALYLEEAVDMRKQEEKLERKLLKQTTSKHTSILPCKDPVARKR